MYVRLLFLFSSETFTVSPLAMFITGAVIVPQIVCSCADLIEAVKK